RIWRPWRVPTASTRRHWLALARSPSSACAFWTAATRSSARAAWPATSAASNYVGQAPKDRQDVSWASGEGVPDVVATQWAADKLRLGQAQRVSRGAG